MVFGGKKFSYFPPLTFLSLLLLQLRLPVGAVVATRCLYCCCLRILEPGGLNCWTLGCWAVVFPLDYENNFNLMNDELWGRGILTENFLAGGRSVSNCWTLVCWAVVLSTRPRSSCWENNFGTSWWSVRLRNLTELWGQVIWTENILSPRPWTWIARPRI